MTTSLPFKLTALVILIATAFPGLATAAPSITFYEAPSYGGDFFQVTGSGEISNLRNKSITGGLDNWNDEISSIWFQGDFRLTLYRDINFQGSSVTISLSRSYLGSIDGNFWDDTVSSIRWEPLFGGDSATAIFYDQPNYTGNSFTVSGYKQISRLIDKRRGGSSRRNWNDQIRSVRLLGDTTEVILYSDSRFRGASLVVSQSIPNLRNLGFSATASSLKLLP